MKFNIRKVSIFGLAAIFFASVMMCCCLTETVQAEEPASSCHQTFQETDSPQDGEECDCDQSFAIIKKDVVLNDLLAKAVSINIEQQTNNQIYFSPIVVAHQSPSQFYDTTRLYIKNSVLRI